MDSRMIDVAIGLVMVFALSGLAVTTLHEIYASLGKSRGKNLERAIGSMLQDVPGSQFTGLLLTHPLIASLTDKPMIGQGKPSYIGADAFVTVLVSQLTRLYTAGVRPDTPAELVAAMRRGAGNLATGNLAAANHEPSAALVSTMNTLLSGTETDWDTYLKRLSAWYDAVGERSSGWFKRATQMRLFMIGLLLAAIVNINPFVIAPRLWNDKALREAVVDNARRLDGISAAATGASAPDAGEQLARMLSALARQPVAGTAAAASSPTAGHVALEAEVDARLAAFERNAVALANTAGERPGVPLLADIQRLLELMPDIGRFIKLRRTLALAGDRQGVLDASRSIDNRVAQAGELLGQKPTPASDRNAGGNDRRPVSDDGGRRALARLGGTAKTVLLQAHDDLTDALRSESRRLSTTPAADGGNVCPLSGDPAAQRLCETLGSFSHSLAATGLPVGWTASNLPDCAGGPCALALIQERRTAQLVDKAAKAPDGASPVSLLRMQGDETRNTVALCLRDGYCAGVSLLGWAVTALAAMLGAPFWFDLLGRLIKIRGSGGKPGDDGAGDTAQAKNAPIASLLSPPAQLPPGPVDGAVTMRDVQTAAEARLSPARVRELQSGTLRNFGAQPTGFFDENTRQAIMAWQSSRSEPVTGELTQAQIEQLLVPAALPAISAPSDASANEDHADGCDCDMKGSTMPDHELPASRGGVQAQQPPGANKP